MSVLSRLQALTQRLSAVGADDEEGSTALADEAEELRRLARQSSAAEEGWR